MMDSFLNGVEYMIFVPIQNEETKLTKFYSCVIIKK